jgi:ankyrin repeat protein
MQALPTKAWNFAKSILWGLPCAIFFAALLTAAPTGLFFDLVQAQWRWGCPCPSYVFQESIDGNSYGFCWRYLFFDLFFWILFFALTGFAIRVVSRKLGLAIRPFYSICIMGALMGVLYVYFYRPYRLINAETGGYLSFLETPAEQMDHAIRVGDIEKVQILLKNNPDLVFSKSITGETLLDNAAYWGQSAIVKLLLADKVDVTAKNMYGDTPLFGPAMNGYLGTTELLLKNGAEVNIRNHNGDIPLLKAAESRSSRVVKLLLENKADINATNNDGYTALHEAAMDGYRSSVQLLIASNAEINVKNNRGETPLYLAVENGHKEVVELLLANKANVNAGDKYGTTPLQLAVDGVRYPSEELNSQTYQDIVELLKQHGATNN